MGISFVKIIHKFFESKNETSTTYIIVCLPPRMSGSNTFLAIFVCVCV